MCKAAEEKAKSISISIVFSAVDAGGNLMLLTRMENAFISSIDIAANKAFTALALKQGTHEVTPVIQPGASLYGLQLTNNCRISTFGGGLPIIVDDQVVGAIGVSGGTVEEDMSIAKYALDSINDV
jgi:uncharacterized protein GlcG (DUF336 family)